MENASYALRIAGGVLIGVLILSLLVVGYNNLRDYNKVQSDENSKEQIANFNKQYDAYQKNLYGADVLSLANKMQDYNIRESDAKGYMKMDIGVTFKSNYQEYGYGFKNNQQYNLKDFLKNYNDLKNKRDDLAKEEVTYEYRDDIVYYTFEKLTKFRGTEYSFVYDHLINGGKQKVDNFLNEYKSLDTLEKNIKAKLYKFTGVDYDNSTGRIIKMYYELN